MYEWPISTWEHTIISSFRAPKLQLAIEQPSTGRHWNPPKKDTPHPRTKEKPQQNSRRGTITIISNPIPSEWETHNLENIDIKEVLALLWRFSAPHQAPQPGDAAKGLGMPRESDFEGQWDLIIGLPQDWGKQTPALEGTNKILHTPRPRGKEQWPHRRRNQSYLLVLEGHCGVMGSQGLTPQGAHWQQQSWKVPVSVSPLGGSH